MIHCQALTTIAVLLLCLCSLTGSGDQTAGRDLDVHMKTLEARTNEEGEIPLSKYGSGTFAEGVCKAQNLAEQGRFAEAVGVLEGLVTEDTASDWRQMLNTRIGILSKWATTDHVDPADYRTFYLEVGPEWFRERTAPIVRAWQEEDFAQVEKLFLIAELCRKRNDTKGYILAISAIPDMEGVVEADATRALLAAGIACHESGEKEKAQQFWTEVARHPSAKPSWAKAVFNLGILAEEQKEFSAAIEHFHSLLRSKPNDTEQGAQLMEAYRSYSHRSALEISRCYEAMGAYHRALRHAWLAKYRYPHRSWCGTCQMSENASLNMRIAYLALRAYGVWVIICVAALLGVRRYRRRRTRSEQSPPGLLRRDVRGEMMMKGIAILVCLLLAGCASPQPTRVALPTGHTVQRGESLALIAQRYYGEENRSEGIKAIMRANPQIGRGPGIQTKLVLTIPKLKED